MHLRTGTLLVLCFAVRLSHHIVIKTAVILMESAPEPFDMRRVGPAIDIAVEKVHTDNTGVSFKTIYSNYSGVCPYEPPVGLLSELYHTESIMAVLGPACSQGLLSAGRLAQHLRLPMVTGLGDLIIRQDNVDMFKTMTILSYDLRKLSYSVSAILNEYQWQHTAILYDLTYVFFELAGSNLVADFKQSNDVARPYDIPFKPSTVKDYGDLLNEAKAHARVFIIFCNSDMLRDILFRAYQLGMTEGDYVFITMELFPSDWLGYYTQFLRGDEKDTAVTRAYESVLILTLRQPDNPEYEAFAEEVKRRAKSDYGYEFAANEKVNYFITAFYDSAIYLAMSYKAVLDEGGDITDGMHVAQRLWNSTFQGITGPVKVDEVGNRVADFDLLDMKAPTTREFQRIGRFRGATQKYIRTPGISSIWPRGLPIDMPKCGFSGEKCISTPEDRTSTIIAASCSVVAVLFVVLSAVLFIYRKFRMEQELGRKSWLVDHHDLHIRKGRINDSFLSKSFLSIDTKDEPAQMFTQTGFCRNQTVAIRRLHLQNVEITRELSIEFRQMQLASHGNLAKFIGACLEPDNKFILMEYCPRGSLQDMLQNDSIDLDWAFRYSLICDIIKGMSYLHSSPLRVHGRLSSTNCVIDSRFALKLTDYGPKSLLSRDREEDRKRSTLSRTFNYEKLLWTAPEVLRTNNNNVTSKSDVYSFGIILQEIVLRSGPYEDKNMEVEEVLKCITTKSTEPFRPTIPTEACSVELTTMMKHCWSELPEDRPTFYDMDETFRKMRAGKTTNIMDNLLARMSNYADNLETLAAERTKAYLEEKQKVEELLHRLLPPSVAKQLESGQSVRPECYDCVSIYFSDIVGFTSIAGKSSPIEVVDLLNDLYTAFDNAIDRFKVYKSGTLGSLLRTSKKNWKLIKHCRRPVVAYMTMSTKKFLHCIFFSCDGIAVHIPVPKGQKSSLQVETIGDAYMCVSGLPERIGDLHVTEICNMSLVILHTVRGFKIRHMPNEALRVRIGLHSGPVVAGVVGLTMPRYCLFGDTVNTASRMESTSEALKIQMSPTTKELLDKFPNYNVEERGEIEVKGKGLMTTYWLQEMPERKESVILYPGSQPVH